MRLVTFNSGLRSFYFDLGQYCFDHIDFVWFSNGYYSRQSGARYYYAYEAIKYVGATNIEEFDIDLMEEKTK